MIDASFLWEDPWLRFVLEVVLKATLVLVVAALATAAMRSMSAACRHRVWSLSFASILILPLTQLAVPGWQWQVLPQRPIPVEAVDVEVPVSATLDMPARRAAALVNSPSEGGGKQADTATYGRVAESVALSRWTLGTDRIDVAPHASLPGMVKQVGWGWLLGIWLAGFAATVAPLVAGAIRNLRFKRQARSLTDAALKRRLATLCVRLGLRHTPAVLLGDDRQMPMTFGFHQPVVVMPATVGQWTDERFSSVALHELAHIQRGDVAWQLVARIACGMYWFNPVAWWGLRQMRRDRELSCDDCVLAIGQNSTSYASELLNIAREHASNFASICGALTMARPSQLEGRILAVLDAERTRTPVGLNRTLLLAFAAGTLVAGLCSVRPDNRVIAADDGVEATAGLPAGLNGDRCFVTGVVLSPDGEPIANAPVQLFIHGNKGGWSRALPGEENIEQIETNADGDGRFQFDVQRNIAVQRKASLIAAAAGLFPAVVSVDTRLPSADAQLQLLNTKSIRLQLVDSGGVPVSGVSLQIRYVALDGDNYTGSPLPEAHKAIEAWPNVGPTDDEGYVAIDVPTTTTIMSLIVNDVQRGCHKLEVKVTDGPVSAVLPAATFLHGRVIDADGTAVVGAEVTLMEEPYRRVTTDAAGGFKVARGSTVGTLFPNGESIIHIYPPADSELLFKAQEWKWPNDGIGDAELTITLDRGVMVEGQVVEGRSRAPVEGAQIVFEPQVENNSHFNESLRSRFAGADMRYVSDAAGRFRMPVIHGPGRLLVKGPTLEFVPVEISMGDLWYGKPGLQREYHHGVARLDLKEGTTPTPISIELVRGSTIRRHVLRPDGSPAKGVVFAASYLVDSEQIGGWIPSLSVVEGAFEMPGFDSVRSTPLIILDVNGQCGCVVSPATGHVSPEETTIKLNPCGSAKFRFVNDKGDPLANYQPPIQFVFKSGAPATHHIEPDQPLWSDTIIWENVVRPSVLPATNNDGFVVVTGLIPGASYQLYYPGAEGSWTEGYPFMVKGGGTTDVGEVVIPQQD